jgi:hypothetical protein
VTQACRVCGCTNDNCILCMALSGGPCWWVEKDLCSRCSPDQRGAGEILARDVACKIAETTAMPGVIVVLLDRSSFLHVGVATVDQPIAAPLHEIARGLHAACDRVLGTTAPLPPTLKERARCIHCMLEVAAVDDLPAIKQHATTCAASPVVQELARVREDLAALQRNLKPVDVVFDGPPGHESGRFVEVENGEGKSLNVGTWIDRKDGMWALRVWADCTPTSPKAVAGG